MIRRTLTGLVGAVVLVLSLASTALAEEPNGNETFGSGFFTRTVDGVDYNWFIQADRETVLGTSLVFANYNAAVDTTCDNGDPGALSIIFSGQATVPIAIPRNLGYAVGGARIRGTETTFDFCTGLETQVDKSFTVGLALVATAPPVTSSDAKCIGAGQLFSSSFTFRTAAGSAFVNGRRFTITGGIIGHQVWSTTADPTCTDI
jgi:hypothetical protein